MANVFPQVNHRWSESPSVFRRHGLSIVLVSILVVQTVAFWFSRYPEWMSDQQSHGGSASVWPDFVLHFSSEYLVSILADTYGALLLVVLTKWFYEQGSNENGQGGSDGSGGTGGTPDTDRPQPQPAGV